MKINENSATKEIFKNDEWRKRDFEEDYIKNTLNEFKMTVRITSIHSNYEFRFKSSTSRI